jgi:hypothetical protein
MLKLLQFDWAGGSERHLRVQPQLDRLSHQLLRFSLPGLVRELAGHRHLFIAGDLWG